MEEHRIARLKEWIDEFDGKVANFVRYYDLPRSRASYISQLLSGVRPLGERAARKLEQECHRPVGWLDHKPAADEPAEVFSFDKARCAKLSAEDRKLVESFIELLLQRNESRDKVRFSETTVRFSDAQRLKDVARRTLKNAFSKQGTDASTKTRKRNRTG